MNIIRLMKTVLGACLRWSLFSGIVRMNGMRMNIRMYLRTSSGLTELPIRVCVMIGVSAMATT